MKLAIVLVLAVLFIGCAPQGDRTDEEMFQAASDIYENYVFEYRIDKNIFSKPISKTLPSGGSSYAWIIIGTEKDPLGIEVLVPKPKKLEPEMVLIGDVERWYPFVNSKKTIGK